MDKQLNFWKLRVQTENINKKIENSNVIPILSSAPNINQVTFYRGESKDYGETSLMPSSFRDCDEKSEYYDAITNFPKEFEGLSSLSKLAKMQHYNYRTRLLDLTENPLVALWFACSDYSRDNATSKEKSDGCFYVITTERDNVLSYDSDRALLLSCLSKLSDSEEKPLLLMLLKMAINDDICKDSSNDHRISEKWIEKYKTSYTGKNARVFEKYIGEVNRERGAFAHYYTRVEDLLSTFIVRPKIENERQRRQSGLFAIFGMQDQSYSNSEEYKITKYIVPASKKPCICDELDKLGINEATLFGDIESRAHYIHTKSSRKLLKTS